MKKNILWEFIQNRKEDKAFFSSSLYHFGIDLCYHGYFHNSIYNYHHYTPVQSYQLLMQHKECREFTLKDKINILLLPFLGCGKFCQYHLDFWTRPIEEDALKPLSLNKGFHIKDKYHLTLIEKFYYNTILKINQLSLTQRDEYKKVLNINGGNYDKNYSIIAALYYSIKYSKLNFDLTKENSRYYLPHFLQFQLIRYPYIKDNTISVKDINTIKGIASSNLLKYKKNDIYKSLNISHLNQKFTSADAQKKWYAHEEHEKEFDALLKGERILKNPFPEFLTSIQWLHFCSHIDESLISEVKTKIAFTQIRFELFDHRSPLEYLMEIEAPSPKFIKKWREQKNEQQEWFIRYSSPFEFFYALMSSLT